MGWGSFSQPKRGLGCDAGAVPWPQKLGVSLLWLCLRHAASPDPYLRVELVLALLLVVSHLGPPSPLSLATLTIRDRCLPFLPCILWRSRNLLFYMRQSNENSNFVGAQGLSIP